MADETIEIPVTITVIVRLPSQDAVTAKRKAESLVNEQVAQFRVKMITPEWYGGIKVTA